jgi:hypothetical protein
MADYMDLDTPLLRLGLTPGSMRLYMRAPDPQKAVFDALKTRFPGEMAAVLLHFTQRAFEAYATDSLLPISNALRDSMRAIRTKRRTHANG